MREWIDSAKIQYQLARLWPQGDKKGKFLTMHAELVFTYASTDSFEKSASATCTNMS